MDPATDPPPSLHAPPRPLATGLRLLLPLFAVAALIVLLLGAVAAGTRWLLATENGSRWLLQHLPGVAVQGWRGALLDETWQVERLRVSWSGGREWLEIEQLRASGFHWQWRPSRVAWIGLEGQSLVARKATLHTVAAAQPQPLKLPASIAPPLQLTLAQLRLDELAIDALAPLRDLAVDGLALDPRPGAEHRVERYAFAGYGVSASGTLRIGTAAPFALAGQAALHPTLEPENPRWGAALRAGGTLERLQLDATLRGRPLGGHEAPSVDLRTTLLSGQSWLPASLSLRTEALDLAALLTQAPTTRLSGSAELVGGTKGEPLRASISIDNAAPGRWNERRLPLQRLTLQAQGELARPDRLEVPQFELVLADASKGAGRWSGSALWQGHELRLETRLAAVTPQRLDGRAAAMTLGGPLSATIRGLPTPDFGTATAATPAPAFAVDGQLDLEGRLDASPQPVQIKLGLSADAEHVELRKVRARAGNASAELGARIDGLLRGPWRVQSTGTLHDFDPLPWWPGDPGSAWRQGRHRVSADWRFDVRLPPAAAALAPLELAQRLAGTGKLSVHDTLIAGVPTTAEITLGYRTSPAPAAGSLRAQVNLGGNRLTLQGDGDPGGSGDGDRWRAELGADALAALAPLARLDPALADWLPRQGTARATLSAEGRWPRLRTQGSAELSQLRMGKLGVARGSASWRLGTVGDQPLALQIDLADVRLASLRADHLRAELRGTLADHHIQLTGALPIVPPAAAVQVLGIEAQSGMLAQLQAQGSWRAATGKDGAAAGARWRADIESLTLGSWDGGSADTPSASTWVAAKDLRAELQFDAHGELVAIQADPGRVRVADALDLRWDEVRVGLAGARPQLQLHADIDAFALAPLLARAQPGMNWGGDLRLAARVDIRAGERVDADLVFERRDGDLHVSSGEGTQLLGLSDFRLALSAHDGLWTFTPVLRGRSLGEITGELRVRSTPEQRWPQRDDAIEGSVQARVADIGIWGTWVPPGWRLTGELGTTAGLGGRFGAPQFTGKLVGKGLGVRNLLQGVNVSDGQIEVTLAGETAKVERFTLRGGDGTVTLTGGATLGSAPQARLQLEADRFRVLGRVDRQLIVSGNAALALDTEQGRLDGRLVVDEGLIDASHSGAPTLDDDVVVVQKGSAPEPAPTASAPRPRRNFTLDVAVDLGKKLRVRGRGLDTALAGELHLTAPAGRLAVDGTVSTVGGTYAAYGQKLEIERGVLAFSGAADNPRLDVLALRPKLDIRVGVAITGPVAAPRVRLYSEPEMSDSDKLSWLVLGRAPDGLGRSDTALLQGAAMALLAGEGEAPTDALLRGLGLDELSLRQSDGEVRETVVAVGKQLGRGWYLGYERGVNATTGTWQLTYRIAQRFTLRAQSGLDNALDLIWTWRVQETPADAAMRKSTIVPP